MANWILKSEFIPGDGESLGNNVELYPLDIATNEEAYGFQQAVIPSDSPHLGKFSHIQVVIVDLGDNLIAVKTILNCVGIRYAIWNGNSLKVVKECAINVAHLHERFPR